ncbi:MAG TPA: hypothetical protein VLM16_02980, partial [Ginsengibacter sp.]|nr:hypothetical protein [Ginsengibacter sp.]
MTKHATLYILFLIVQCAYGQNAQKTKQNGQTLPITIDVTKGRDTFQYFSRIDTNYNTYKLPNNFTKPKNWRKADDERKGLLGDWYGGTYS